jgi:hypothetical protein
VSVELPPATLSVLLIGAGLQRASSKKVFAPAAIRKVCS